MLISFEVNFTFISELRIADSPHAGKGKALICDFAITKVGLELTENTASKTVPSGDSVRRSAIELLEGIGIPPTMNADTYSFAMLILECITEKQPYPDISRDAKVIHVRIVKRQLPHRPVIQDPKDSKFVSDDLWDLMMRCWREEPETRPTMEHVHSFFADHNRWKAFIYNVSV